MHQEKAIPFDDLVAFVSGDLTTEDGARMESRLTGSPAAAATVARLREVLETMRTDDSAAPSRAAVRRALAAFSPAEAAPSLVERAVRSVARLVFDSRVQPALAGYRGGASSSVMLGYESELGRVDVQLTPPAGPEARWRLRGQIRAAGSAVPETVSLVASGAEDSASPVTMADADASGRFRLECPAGRYDLIVGFDGEARTVVLQEVEVG